jgi:hypothetical protein
VVALGILIASVLMASTTLYTRALSDLGLNYDLRRSSGDTGAVEVTLYETLLGGQRTADVTTFLEGSLETHFGDIAAPGHLRVRRVGPFHMLSDHGLGAGANYGAQIASLDGWEAEAVFEGRAPRLPTLRLDPGLGFPVLDGPLEVAIPRFHADLLRIEVGDAFPIADAYDECDREPPLPDGSPPPDAVPCQTSAIVSLRIPVEVVGIFEARDPDLPFWRASWDSLRSLGPTLNPALFGTVPFFVHSEAPAGPLAQIIPGYSVDLRVRDAVPVAAFDSDGVPADLARFDALREDVGTANAFTSSRLDDTLRRFEAERDFSVVPILLILIQVVAVVFFFIVVMARLLVGRESEELILLRGRGASLLQVVGLYVVQLTPIVLAVAAIAPLVAAGAISALGFVGAFRHVTGADWIATPLTPQAWALALAGAALAVVAVLIPVVVAAHVRPGAARYVAARPAGATVVQRYYLDVAFLAVAGFLVWAVSARDAVFTRDTLGGLSTDPLVLIAPALIGLVAVVLVLRLLPVVLGGLAWLTRDRLAMPIAAALRQAVRNPGPLARLSLLLMLAGALGTFAASYGGTVVRSFEERERYVAGADLRSRIDSASPGVLQEQLAGLPGAPPAALVARRTGSISRTGRGVGGTVQLLGVESQRAASFLWFRDDFTETPPADLLPPLAPAPSLGGIAVPDDVAEFSVAVHLSELRDDISIWVQLRDRAGRFVRVLLGSPQRSGEWEVLRAPAFETVQARNAEPPYTLHAITYTEAQNRSVSEPGTLRIDDVTAITQDGEAVLIEGFETPGQPWRQQPLALAEASDEIERRTDGVARSGDGAMEYRWSAGISPGRRGVYLPAPNNCDSRGVCALNVVASTSFLRAHGLRVGALAPFRMTGFSVDVRIIDSVEFFPTLDPQLGGGFLIADVFDLHHLGTLLSFRDPVAIREVWVQGSSDPGLRERTILALAELSDDPSTIDQQVQVARAGDDPLVAAGGSGILLVSFIAVGILVIVAFLVSVIFSARERMLEMAVLRTLGIGRRTLLGQLIVEYAIVAVVGLALGTFLGDRISRLMLRFLEVNEEGDRVLPPFILTTDWTTVGASYLVLVAMLALGVAIAWRLYIRESITRSLRLAV